MFQSTLHLTKINCEPFPGSSENRTLSKAFVLNIKVNRVNQPCGYELDPDRDELWCDDASRICLAEPLRTGNVTNWPLITTSNDCCPVCSVWDRLSEDKIIWSGSSSILRHNSRNGSGCVGCIQRWLAVFLDAWKESKIISVCFVLNCCELQGSRIKD